MSDFEDLALSMEVLEVMELIGVGVMCPTCLCLHIKPLKLAQKWLVRQCFTYFYPLKHILAVMERSNGTPVHITMLMFSVICNTSPKICFNWVSGASDIIKIKPEKGFQAYVAHNYTL